MVGPLNVAKMDTFKAKIGVENAKSLILKPIMPFQCCNFISEESGLMGK